MPFCGYCNSKTKGDPIRSKCYLHRLQLIVSFFLTQLSIWAAGMKTVPYFRWAFIFLLLPVFFAGCNRGQDSTQTKSGNASERQGIAAKSESKVQRGKIENKLSAANEIDDDAILEWAETIQNAVLTNEKQVFLRNVRLGETIEERVRGVGNKEFAKGYVIGAKQSIGKLFDQFVVSDYTFTGLKRSKSGVQKAVFRITPPAGGVSYHLWDVEKTSSGKLIGKDIFVVAQGERMSSTMRRIAILVCPKDDRSFLEKLVGKEKSLAGHHLVAWEVLQNHNRRNFEAAISAYEKLPAQLKNSKTFKLVQVMSFAQVPKWEERYMKSIEEYQELFPDDPSVDLVSLDLLMLRGEHEKADAAIDRIEEVVGNDGFLTSIRGNNYNFAGEKEKAIKKFKEAIELEPQLMFPYLLLHQVHVQDKEFEKALKNLKLLVDRVGPITLDESDPINRVWFDSPQYPEFVKYNVAASVEVEPNK